MEEKELGEVLVKTDVLGGPHWGIGGGFTHTCAVSGLLPPPLVPFC